MAKGNKILLVRIPPEMLRKMEAYFAERNKRTTNAPWESMSEFVRECIADKLRHRERSNRKRERYPTLWEGRYSVQTWYDRKTRSWVTQLKDGEGNQVGDAQYDAAHDSVVISRGALLQDARGLSIADEAQASLVMEAVR